MTIDGIEYKYVVYESDRKRYRARYTSKNLNNGKIKYIGVFPTELEAAKAYYNTIKELGYDIPDEFVNLRFHPH